MPSHLESSPRVAVTQAGDRPRSRIRCLSPLCVPTKHGEGDAGGFAMGTSAPIKALWCFPKLPCPLRRLPCADWLSSAWGVALQSRTVALTNLIFLLFFGRGTSRLLLAHAAGEPGACSLLVPSLSGASQPAKPARTAPPWRPRLLFHHSLGD